VVREQEVQGCRGLGAGMERGAKVTVGVRGISSVERGEGSEWGEGWGLRKSGKGGMIGRSFKV